MTHYLLDGIFLCGGGVELASHDEATTELLEVTCPACVDVLTHVGAFRRSVAAPCPDDASAGEPSNHDR